MGISLPRREINGLDNFYSTLEPINYGRINSIAIQNNRGINDE